MIEVMLNSVLWKFFLGCFGKIVVSRIVERVISIRMIVRKLCI